KAYTRYARLFSERPDAAEMLQRAAAMAEKAGDARQEIADLEELARRFSSQGERVVQAHLKRGLALRRLGDDSAARGAFEEACGEFDRRRFTPQDALAAASA